MTENLKMLKPALVIIPLVLFLVECDGIEGRYTSIFSFGDSLADTGNAQYDEKAKSYIDYPPYGETYFGAPTGRYSNGRLVVDFIAQAFGLPLLPAYLKVQNEGKHLGKGVNFAAGGATALNASFFRERKIFVPSNFSLGVQVQWFRQLLPSLCASPSGCQAMFRNSLFLMGEIGGNDYNLPLFQGRSLQKVKTTVPKVVATISSAIRTLIEEGVITLLVPGNLNIGCSPSYLTIFQSSNKNEYDPSSGCLKWLNELAQYHNHLLQNEVNRLKELYSHSTILYVDYYNLGMDLYRTPYPPGITSKRHSACCGGGGPYNYNMSVFCGSKGSTVCDDPSSYVSWDGIHSTEATYKWLANGILKQLSTIP